MKPEDYNPKAREAFGKSLIDIGVAIFKGIILLFTVVPLAAILQIAINGNKKPVSLFDMLSSLSPATQWTFVGFLALAFIAGFVFRREGLRHIHELENVKYMNWKMKYNKKFNKD
jgi:hypothetical protein